MTPASRTHTDERTPHDALARVVWRASLWLRMRVRSSARSSMRAMRNRAMWNMTVLALAATLAACTSSRPSTPRPPSKAQIVSAGIDRSLPRSTWAAQAAVLRTWIAGERLYYRYMDEPAASLRTDLLAGETPAELFPQAQEYATGSSLQSEYQTLSEMKLDLLRGPTSYNLGQPRIVDFSSHSARISFCIYDTGTTTTSGRPGPPDLDGGSGGTKGYGYFELSGRHWTADGGSTHFAKTC